MTRAPIPITEPSFDETEIEAIRAVLGSKWVTQGPQTEKFEQQIAAFCGARHVFATTSATAALHLAAAALDLGPGDEVIVPAFTWVTSAYAVEYVGASARLVDVDPSTFNLDPAKIEAAVTARTKAVIAVHLFGLAAPMNAILDIARRRGLRVIEDAACAIGTTLGGRPVGVLGDIGCFSFHPRKIVTTGEGGAATTNDAALATKLRYLRNHGATGLPDAALEPHGPWTMATFEALGFNLRFSDIQAAIGVAQMAKLPRLLAERRARARRYFELLAPFHDLALPSADAGHTYQSYVIRVAAGGRARRNKAMAAMAAEGIQTRPGTHAIHRLGYLRRKYGWRPEDFPCAAAAEDETITLPIVPGMTDADQDRVVSVLKKGLA
ncbi:MAG: DegT/DnrJ/EryC1/StrS family aminotransferase [Parvularculaceae bacterium]|nr:DegT/DnrJ/EryC1/StrS family aminotransferase [Parvularculaceae bacterium]